MSRRNRRQEDLEEMSRQAEALAREQASRADAASSEQDDDDDVDVDDAQVARPVAAASSFAAASYEPVQLLAAR